jgi:uncharacterized protein (TIGR02145 family)
MRLLASAAVIAVCVLCGSVFAQSGTFTDIRDKSKYKTVVIGGKRWMAANLNYAPDSGNSWCYKNEKSRCDAHGRLYDWETARSVCPSGYHLPSDGEWEDLVKAAGGDLAGTALKSKSGWFTLSGLVGKDKFGFSALPGGCRFPGGSGNFDQGMLFGYWWTATEIDDKKAVNRIMFSSDSNGTGGERSMGSRKEMGFSVRCVGD